MLEKNYPVAYDVNHNPIRSKIFEFKSLNKKNCRMMLKHFEI